MFPEAIINQYQYLPPLPGDTPGIVECLEQNLCTIVGEFAGNGEPLIHGLCTYRGYITTCPKTGKEIQMSHLSLVVPADREGYVKLAWFEPTTREIHLTDIPPQILSPVEDYNGFLGAHFDVKKDEKDGNWLILYYGQYFITDRDFLYVALPGKGLIDLGTFWKEISASPK